MRRGYGFQVGEQKRRIKAGKARPCLCGSSKPAEQCCLKGANWHKPAAVLGLRDLPARTSISQCYMSELNSCDGKISGEHLISKSIIELLADKGEFMISGLPWMKPDEVRAIGVNRLVSKRLCEKHNSSLHHLDDAALAFFAFLKRTMDLSSKNQSFLMSGHDLERWLLKTLKAFAVSGNLGGHEKLSGEFTEHVSVLAMLDDTSSWPEGSGLYCVMLDGQFVDNHNRFRLMPYMNDNGEVAGLACDILGLSFILMLEPISTLTNPQLTAAIHRPAEIRINAPGTRSILLLSWEDGRNNSQAMSLRWLQSIANPDFVRT
jgi:hypothetical protein